MHVRTTVADTEQLTSIRKHRVGFSSSDFHPCTAQLSEAKPLKIDHTTGITDQFYPWCHVEAAKNNGEHWARKMILQFLAGKFVQTKLANIFKLQTQGPFCDSILYALAQGQLSGYESPCRLSSFVCELAALEQGVLGQNVHYVLRWRA